MSIALSGVLPLPRGFAGRRCFGFTLIELIVVMILVGILAVVALPRLNLLSGFKDPGFRDEIMATLEYGRKSAVARRRYTCVVVGADSKLTLTAELVTPDAHAGTCPYAAALNLPSGVNILTPPSNVTVTSPALPLTIQFNAEGRPTVGGGTTITVTDSSGGTSSSVTLEAETGYVH